MNSPICLPIIVLFLFATCSRSLRTESYVRVQHEDDSTKHVVMTQGERAVGFHLDPEGGILSCQVFKRNELILKMLNLEKEEMTGGLNVEYLTMNIDVAWYGRRCSKFIRDKERLNDRSDSRTAKLLDEQLLKRAVLGTKFCTSLAPKYNSMMDIPDMTPTDVCCRDLTRCPSQISPLHYRFGLLNIYPYRLFSCECLEDFKRCLNEVEDDNAEQAKEVKRLFFDQLDMECTIRRSYKDCDDGSFSTWFERCENGTVVEMNFIAKKEDRDQHSPS